MGEDGLFTAKCTHRHTATNDFAQASQVGSHAIALLRAATTNPKTSHHLVKNQYRAVFVTNIAQALQKAIDRRNTVHVAGNRLNNNTGNIIAHFSKHLLNAIEVIVFNG